MRESLQAFAEATPDSVALSNESEPCCFTELLARVDRLTPAFRSSGPPRRVLLALPGGPDFTAAQLAVFEARAVLIPVPSTATDREAASTLAMIQPDVVVVESREQGRAWLEALTEPATVLCSTDREDAVARSSPLDRASAGHDSQPLPDGTAIVQFTSGSSGRPKGILISRENIRAYLRDQHPFLSGFGRQQVFCPVPQFHSYGNTIVLEHLAHGTGVHLSNRFLPAADLRRMQEHRCQGLAAPPTYVRLLLQLKALEKTTLPELRWINLGTAPPDPTLIEDLQRCRPDLSLVLRYGLTETFGYVSRQELRPGEKLRGPGQVGRWIPGVEGKAGLPRLDSEDGGEICVRGPAVASHVLVERNRVTRLVDDQGWLATKDLGVTDDDGRLYLRGRSSVFLKRNGFRVDPHEIEDLLRSQPGILDVVVVGLPDTLSGQRIVAAIEANALEAASAPKQLLELCRKNLSAHKVPQEIRVLAAIPRTRSGKPDRPTLIAHLSDVPHPN